MPAVLNKTLTAGLSYELGLLIGRRRMSRSVQDISRAALPGSLSIGGVVKNAVRTTWSVR
jgi:hypothetical protein